MSAPDTAPAPRERPRIAVTSGDCAGIGPELILHALNSEELSERVRLMIYGSGAILERVSRVSGIPFKRPALFASAAAAVSGCPGHILIETPADASLTAIQPGRVHSVCGETAARWIETAARDVIAGRAHALVTAPVSKEAMRLAGVPHPGHTELLAAICGAHDPCMTFFGPEMIVSLATIHTALSRVPSLLDIRKLVRIAALTRDACLRLGTPSPRIGMLALNPHGGENGMFGEEERDIITPAIEEARALGIDIRGPLVPDTAFTWLCPPRRPAPFDAWIAMYHDQALIPFKMTAFDDGVNATLGLPIIRTSPDHGTAFDLAWQGRASPSSFFAAMRLAARMIPGIRSQPQDYR
jgi:4-phospho-D-threonate 3-dehydrogenase / 4-phospho-D-erythronate 3-dehydrogenase